MPLAGAPLAAVAGYHHPRRPLKAAGGRRLKTARNLEVWLSAELDPDRWPMPIANIQRDIGAVWRRNGGFSGADGAPSFTASSLSRQLKYV